jgi:hypothetical protein
MRRIALVLAIGLLLDVGAQGNAYSGYANLFVRTYEYARESGAYTTSGRNSYDPNWGAAFYPHETRRGGPRYLRLSYDSGRYVDRERDVSFGGATEPTLHATGNPFRLRVQSPGLVNLSAFWGNLALEVERGGPAAPWPPGNGKLVIAQDNVRQLTDGKSARASAEVLIHTLTEVGFLYDRDYDEPYSETGHFLDEISAHPRRIKWEIKSPAGPIALELHRPVETASVRWTLPHNSQRILRDIETGRITIIAYTTRGPQRGHTRRRGLGPRGRGAR